MENNLELIFSQFNTGCHLLECGRYGSGHIHETYKIETEGSENFNYILQKLNRKIFRDIPSLQSNIERVTSHIRNKLSKTGVSDIDRRTLSLIKTCEGHLWYKEENGDCWRMYKFISDHRSYDIVDTPGKAYQGGRGIGRFQAQLADLPLPPLNETIPFFHDIENRLETFWQTVTNDPAGRVETAKNEINFVKDREEVMKTIKSLGSQGVIPLRITHNDTKFNNILLDSDDNALCVIDLDTVMPGYVHYDFGDAIRTAANSAAEDETDLGLVYMDIELFEAYAKGYLEEMNSTLNQAEKDWLAFAPRLITFIIGLRFLTDHLDGDNYFRIHHENHNLERARTQFRLVESNEEQYEEMKRIITELSLLIC